MNPQTLACHFKILILIVMAIMQHIKINASSSAQQNNHQTLSLHGKGENPLVFSELE